MKKNLFIRLILINLVVIKILGSKTLSSLLDIFPS